MNDCVPDENAGREIAEHFGLAMHQLFIRAIGSRSAINAHAEAARIARELPMAGMSEDDIRKEIVAGAIARGIPILM